MTGVKLIAAFAACWIALTADHPSTCHVPNLKHEPTPSLQVGGLVSPPGTSSLRSLSYERLLELPQATIAVDHDENLSPGSHGRFRVTGIYLDVLMRSLGASPQADMVDVLCSDGYHSFYSRRYLAAHHPLLALKVEGLPEQDWAAKNHLHGPGSFFITQSNFHPTFKVLSQRERAMIPADVVRLDFVSASRVLGSIAPRGAHAGDPEVIEGYRIAQQHCFRCHNEGVYGGTKAGRTWEMVGHYASTRPAEFERFIRWPQQMNASSTMPPNLDFDPATARALQAYFAGFAPQP